MKITYLKICNYKSIEQLEITDIENALILVGKNNTGKTAVIDAILLAMGMRNCAEHEFLDAGKPISISVISSIPKAILCCCTHGVYCAK